MAKPNYKFDKRQRDIAKKKQQDEKRLKKLSRTDTKGPDDGTTAEPAGTAPGDTPDTGANPPSVAAKE